MNNKLTSWLRKDIRVRIPLLTRSAPSPFARKVSRVLKLLFLLLLFAFVVWRVLLYFEINRRLADIRGAELPTSGAELNTWPRAVPDAANAALVLTQAFALTRTFSDGRSNEVVEPKLLERTNQWSSETRVLVAGYLDMNEGALAKAREALQLSQFRYPVDFSYGPETEMPHLSALKKLARIVALRAVLAAEEGRTEESREHIRLLLSLAATLEDEPILISHLVRLSIIRMAVKVTERSLSRVALGDAGGLQTAFASAAKTNLLSLAFVGERAAMIAPFRLSWSEIQSFNQTDEDQARPRKPQRYSGKPTPLLWLSGFFERDLNFYLQTMDKSISLAALSAPRNLVLTNHFDEASRIAQKRLYILSGMLLPAFTKIAMRDAAALTQLDLASTALAVDRFRIAHGRLPKDLDELLPQFLARIPADPFDGSPLHYRRLTNGFVIYGVDSDGRDDGGREKPERKKSTDKTSYDITLIVER